MKKQSWVIIPIDSHISFEIPSGSLNAVQGYCGNLEGNVESTLHEFEEAKLQLEIPVKFVSISDRSLSSLLSRVKKDAHSTCSVLYVEGVIKETNFDEVYIFSGTLSSAGYKNHFSMSQPFFVAEAFTGTPGVFVQLEDTIKGFAGLVAGQYDHLPEAAFYMPWAASISSGASTGRATWR